MQKGQTGILILVGIVTVGIIILFAPIPYYVGKDKFVCLGIGICPKHGWNLGPSIWQRTSGIIQKTTPTNLAPIFQILK